jgi:hypothetical protein
MADLHVHQRGCTCRGDRHADGSLIVTVACPVHHLMPDGCVAAEHEIRCACGEFRCDHACTACERTDEDGYDMQYVCGECLPTMLSWGWERMAS